ncbi:MAG: PilT/PilU family type 4a pilus ATPase [Lentisphaeria bacterium]|nr:PilT/PilU family type 4a pilus ATPase [Lentisphaeria bacterium]
MPPVMPLEIQWFIYALVSNDALTQSDAQALYRSLGLRANLEDFAQLVLDHLSAGLGDEDVQEMAGQLQEIMEYAVEQSQTGSAPPRVPVPVATAPARTAASCPVPQSTAAAADPASASGGEGSSQGEGLADDSALYFSPLDIDLSQIQSYEDLPSLSDTAQLSDEELADRMICLLTCLRALGCSDLHISGGTPPFVRRQLEVERIDSYVLTAEDSRRLNLALLSPNQKKMFAEKMDMSFALEIGADRFRVCLMEHKDGVGGSYRLVPDHICSLQELGFLEKDVPFIERLLDYNNGLILVTGPIGSGKTTTLAAMVNIINDRRQDHVISVEEPIEILQISKNCQVTQREVGHHTVSYHAALKAALREDPDIIVIGEMHDLETIENAITASETGHLVIGTLHTGDAPSTLNRLLDVFPPEQQPQIRAMTAGSLRGIICQKLVPDGFGGITIVYEVLLNSMAVSNIVNEGKAFRLKATMSTATKQGMCILDQCVYNKFEQGLMTREAALAQMTDASVIAQLEQLHAVREAQKFAAEAARNNAR